MNNGIVVKKSKLLGNGVFAARNFKKGELIESAHLLTFTPRERKILEKTKLNYYVYPWRSTRSAAIALGYGSIYNHSYEPNADWKQDFKKEMMTYKALRDIKKGEEILVNYNGEPDDKTEIDWFGMEYKSK